MLKITGKSLAFLALTLALSPASAARVLIDDTEQRVVLTQALDCYNTAEVRIETARPELYESGTQGLQRVTDAVRAMLYYECPEISEIKIQGMLRGLQDQVYNGRASRHDDWQVLELPLSETQSMAMLLDAIPAEQLETERHTSAAVEAENLSVARIQLGMSLEQVSKTIRERFDVRPVYDAREGLMTLNSKPCPQVSILDTPLAEARTDWKCIEARFSDRRLPELEQLHIVQLAEEDRNSVRQLLVEHYGVPSGQYDTSPDGPTELSWTSEKGDTLRAVLIEMKNGHTVTELELFREGRPVAEKRPRNSGLVL